MDRKFCEDILNQALLHGADFADVFYEKELRRNYWLTDQKIDRVLTSVQKGVGLRVSENQKIFSSSTNLTDEESIRNEMNHLVAHLSGNSKKKVISLKEVDSVHQDSSIIEHADFAVEKKKALLYQIDHIARSYSDKIVQVEAMIFESDQDVQIANTLGVFTTDKRRLTRLYMNIIAKDGNRVATQYQSFGTSGGYEFFENFNLEEEVLKISKIACQKLYAKPCPTGNMPVVIGPGFGAVIIHEACGHALEATSVAKNLSILSNKKGTKIGHEKVTLIDDGTIPYEWGSLRIDDEGVKTQKNVLIENGVLKNYLVDYLNSHIMNCDVTGSGRRESYKFNPTSRMNNTYLQAGNDQLEDMIKSIQHGIYAKKMGGGSVDPVTGDFNFVADEVYLIENGKVGDIVSEASLIGNTMDILSKIDMVGSDLKLETGWCGSESGMVAVTCGQPTIRVSSMLVGGDSSDE